MEIRIRRLGLVDYRDGKRAQDEAASEVLGGAARGMILVLRHPPVITLGRRADPSEVHAGPRQLEAMGIAVEHVTRGGGATYHYPDQAVVYPVLDMNRLRLSVGSLLDIIAASVIDVLSRYGIHASWDTKRPGAYVDGAKIASVGLHISRGISTHGVALNVGPELDGFRLIDPCKQPGLPVTSMAGCIGFSPDPDVVGIELARELATCLDDSMR